MDNLIQNLKSKDVKITPALLSVLKIFKKANSPLNAEFIYRNILKENKKRVVNEATVYRIIDRLREKGILKVVDLRKDSNYFELNDKHHHHIVCTKCNTVEDFENKEIEKNIRRIVEKSSKFIKVNEHSLEIFGVCKYCN